MRRFAILLGDSLRAIVSTQNEPERAGAPELRVLVTHPGQTPDQYAECFGYTLVPTPAWEQRHMRAAQALVDGGADPNRIGLFVVPGGGGC